MRHTVISWALLMAAFMLPVSAVAETTFSLDTPSDGATVAGIVEVSGWLLGDAGSCENFPETCSVSAIDLYVDGVFIASADINIPRYDILQAYPWYAGTPYARPGFSTSFDADALVDGFHSLFLRVSFSDSTVTDFGLRWVNVDSSINQAPFGELEYPGIYQSMNGVFPVTGWALDDGAIDRVEVLVDGLVVGHANLGMHRPDIGHRFPSHPQADWAGFVRMLNTTELSNGTHIVAIRLWDDAGGNRVIGRRYVQTLNFGYNLPPFGGIDWPISNHTMYAVGCSNPPPVSGPPYEDPQNVELVLGWVLDVGSSTDRGGVKWVELLINNTVLLNTLVDDFLYTYFDMDVNYYGHERIDILRLFPDVPNAKDAGFAFALDIFDLLYNYEYHQGLHYLKIRASDIEGNMADIAQIPVIFDCDDDYDRPSWGDIYTPEHMERVSGVTSVTGWAIDFDIIYGVEVWVDGHFVGYAVHTLDSPELYAQFPWYPQNHIAHARFFFEFDTTQLTDGEHLLTIRTEDRFDNKNWLGERPFVVDNLNQAR